jgi:hypothetical protein
MHPNIAVNMDTLSMGWIIPNNQKTVPINSKKIVLAIINKQVHIRYFKEI